MATYLEALNFTLTSSTALAGDMPANLRSAANVYSEGEVNALLAALDVDVTAELALKAPIDSPAFTGTVSGITKAMVGLGNVDNTSDAAKPVSTATQTALDLKAPSASPIFTGTVSGITKSMVGLGNVDNTSDAAKPISTATQAALDLKVATTALTGATVASAGVDYAVALSSGAFRRAFTTFFNVKNYGATGDGVTNDTTAVTAAVTALRAAGGGTLYFPRGTYLIDSFDWDWIAGGYGKFVMRGEGSATILKKRVNDGATFVTIGRDDTTLTYQGSIYLENICFDGVVGGTEVVVDLWSLTLFKASNCRARYGAKAWRVNDCVTIMLDNCQGSDSVRGLECRKYVFGDATFSAANIIILSGGTYKDNSEWGVFYGGGSMLHGAVAVQIENNGTIATPGGGMYVAASAGDVGTNRKSRAVTGTFWFEANKGTAALVLDGGATVLTAPLFIANPDATRDLYSNGGKYVLIDPSMVTAKAGGNIEDTASAATGNIILGGEIVDLTGIVQAKTDLYDVQSGSGATATRVTTRKGRADVQAGATDEKFIQAGLSSGANGSTITFPTAFGAAPRVVANVAANEPTKVQCVKLYNITTTGFQFEKTEIVDGSGGVVVASANGVAFSWIAIGNTP